MGSATIPTPPLDLNEIIVLEPDNLTNLIPFESNYTVQVQLSRSSPNIPIKSNYPVQVQLSRSSPILPFKSQLSRSFLIIPFIMCNCIQFNISHLVHTTGSHFTFNFPFPLSSLFFVLWIQTFLSESHDFSPSCFFASMINTVDAG